MPTAITPTEITPGTSGSYQTVDITSLVGSDAGNVEAVHLRIYAASAQSFGVRATGSTDDEYDAIASTDWQDWTIKVDSSDTFEAHISSTTDVDIYMWGYSTTDEAEFFVNGDDFEADLTEATFSDVDVSALFTGTAQAVFGDLQSSGFNYGTWAVRPDGASFSQVHVGPRSGDGDVKGFAMYCASEIFEMNVANLSERTVLLNGALIDGVTGSATADTYDPHASGESGTWQDTDITAGSNTNAGDTFVIAHVYPTNSQTHTSGIRPDSGGPSHLSAVFTSRAHFSFVPMVSGDIFDLYAADSGQTDPRVAVAVFGTADLTPAGGPTQVALTGSQPASTGALDHLQTADFVAGSQPASTGALTAVQTLARSVTGSQPASTGTVSAKYLIALTGSQPASTGAVSAQQALAIALAGSQPASTGAVTVKYAIALAGSQPASTGALSAAVAGAVALAGNQPASTGALTAVQTLAISLAGSQPSSTGALSVNTGTEVALTGSQPASTGTLSVQQTLFVSLTGAQPAGSGVLSAIQTLAVALAGSQPQSTGVLQAVASYFVLLAGNQPASTGVLTSDGVALSLRVITLTGRWDPEIAMTGRYDPTITMTGRSDPTITLTGQS